MRRVALLHLLETADPGLQLAFLASPTVRAEGCLLREAIRPILAVAVRLEAEAWPALESFVTAEDADPQARAAALQWLSERLPRERLVPLLESPAVRKSAVLLRPAVEQLARLGRMPRAEHFGLLLPTSSPAEAASIAQLLGELGEVRAETSLVDLLAHKDPAVQLAATNSLGKVGSVRVVEPLLALARSAGRIASTELSRAAEASARAIQARLGDVAPGRLSLSEVAAPAGALSVAREEGSVSLADRQADEAEAAAPPQP